MTNRKKVSVLIVDDDYIARIINKNVVESFEQFDMAVEELNSGLEALQFIQEKYQRENKFPDLIILDTAMPVMSGFDFVEAFRLIDTLGNTNIIIVTSSDNPDDIEKSKSLGIKHFLTKPLTFEKLKSAILETIEVS